MFSLEWTICDKSLDSILLIASNLCSCEYWCWEHNKVSSNKQHRNYIIYSELRTQDIHLFDQYSDIIKITMLSCIH